MSAIQILDDSDPAVVYSSGWQKAGGSNEYNGTTSWTNQPGTTATLVFIGVQVSVVGTIGPSGAGLLPPESNYTVDRSPPVVYPATQDQSVHYNTRFYVSPILPDGQHTLVVTNLLNSDSFFIDYFLVYKSNNDTLFSPKVVTFTTTAGSASQTSGSSAGASNPGSSNSNTATIVGSALGAAVLIVVAVAFIFWLRSRNKRRQDEPIISTFRDDRETVPALGHTPFPSDTPGAQFSPFMTTSSDIAHPSQPVQNIHYELPPPPGYSSDVSQSNIPGPARGNLLTSKAINLSYNTNVVNSN